MRRLLPSSPFRLMFFTMAAMALSACGNGQGGTRDSIRAVGSSTVYPFAKSIAESFARSNPELKSPIIEATGSGGGINLFCAGSGSHTPDIANSSRRMTASEFATCQANGVEQVTEIQVGLDGIALASARGGISLKLSKETIYKALAAAPYGHEQTAKLWSDIDPELPALRILAYGPPSTSGTRDALEELVLLPACEADPAMAEIKTSDKARFRQICTEIRIDGAYVDQGEQDNLIIQKIEGNPNAIGIFGFSYLEENSDRVQGLSIDGIEPDYESISTFAYPGARPLYIYVKNAHLDAIPGLREFIAQWTRSWGPDGPLTAIGMVANPQDVATRSLKKATDFSPLSAADFE